MQWAEARLTKLTNTIAIFKKVLKSCNTQLFELVIIRIAQLINMSTTSKSQKCIIF